MKETWEPPPNPVLSLNWLEADGKRNAAPEAGCVWPPYLPRHQISHRGATGKDSGVVSILNLAEPEKRKGTEPRAWSMARPQSRHEDCGREGTSHRPQGIIPFTGSNICRVRDLVEGFNPFVPENRVITVPAYIKRGGVCKLLKAVQGME